MGKKLFVGSLPYETNDEQLKTMFAACGQVVSARVIIDRETGKSKGFGFVEMGTDEQAAAAIAKLNNSTIGTRRIFVNEARPPEARPPGGGPRPGGPGAGPRPGGFGPRPGGPGGFLPGGGGGGFGSPPPFGDDKGRGPRRGPGGFKRGGKRDDDRDGGKPRKRYDEENEDWRRSWRQEGGDDD